MARFLDGPAEGVTLDLRRAPTYLRAVSRPGGYVGSRLRQRPWDALDLPEDRRNPDEVVEVYKIVPGTWGQVFVRPGGEYQYGDYRHVEVDALALGLDDRPRFLTWAVLHHAEETTPGLGIPGEVGADLTREVDAPAFRACARALGAEEVAPDVWRLDTVPQR
jgi:hypothetical protein